MRWFITKKMLVGLIGLLVAAIFLMALTGCSSTSERSQTQSDSIKVTERHPTPDGGFVEKVTESSTGSKDGVITTKADVDWAGAISKGVGQAATGDWLGLAITGVTTPAAGGAAALTAAERKRRMRAESDADEHYNDYKKLKENAGA